MAEAVSALSGTQRAAIFLLGLGESGAAAIMMIMAAMAARQNRHWHCVPRRGRVGAVFCISTIGAKSPPGPRSMRR